MGDFNSLRDSWVCPTDRELSLRAKLKTGWSVKTNALNSFNKTDQHLNDSEQELIMQVIKRAELLEKAEQERVGRLVERIENMKKNAMGNGTTQCILCADEFGILGATPQACADCKKAVCTKCGVDTIGLNKEVYWMCKICAEVREMWKKSGAWFFKSLPKYTLPAKKQEPSKYKPKGLSSPRVLSTWSQARAQDSMGKDSTESSDEDTMKLGSRINKKRVSPKKSFESNNVSFVTTGNENIQSPSSNLSATSPITSTTSTFGGNISPSSCLPHVYAHLEVETVESIQAASSRREEKLSWTPSPQENTTNKSPATDTANSPILDDQERSLPSPKLPPSSGLGILEFSLNYNPHQHALHCTVYRAKGLRPMDFNGLSDPYIKLLLFPPSNKPNKQRTKTVHKTLNPEFNETVSFYNLSEEELQKKVLRLVVHDEDVYSQEAMGETEVPLNTLLNSQESRYFYTPLTEPSLGPLMGDEDDRGAILLSLMYSHDYRALIVGVVRASKLMPRDTNGYADPFVRLCLKPDPLRRRFKTTVRKKTLNPEFNEEFAFEISPHEVSKCTLEVTVWDKDYGKSDDYIGGIQLGIHSKGGRLQHWLDTLKNSNTRLERWHSLSSTPMKP